MDKNEVKPQTSIKTYFKDPNLHHNVTLWWNMVNITVSIDFARPYTLYCAIISPPKEHYNMQNERTKSRVPKL